MSCYFMLSNNFNTFIDNMLKSIKVIAPVAKKNKFVFQELKTVAQLRLDYDITILPPKKAIFPTHQDLVKFDGNSLQSAINPIPQVLFGVHFYDVKAIYMLDNLFRAGHADNNYLAVREVTTIVASNIQNISDRGFWATASPELEAKGHDAFLTKLPDGYVFETLTPKGEALLKYGDFQNASDAQVNEAKKINEDALKKCKVKLNYTSTQIAQKMHEVYSKKEIWQKLSEKCFSCGTCNMVCPTCYCFDVQDVWNLDQVSGKRFRMWDGCMLEDFAKVSLGGGSTENFREERFQRYRHRVMRKTVYLNDKLGVPACVGCGRCSTECVPDIADPVNIINTVMEGK